MILASHRKPSWMQEVSASGIQITKHKQGSPRKKQTKKKPNKSNRSKSKLLQGNLVVKNEEED